MVATYAWISGGEIPSQRLRSYTFGLAAALGFLAAWLATFTAPYFINPESLNWGPKYGYIWTPCCWLGALWVFFFLPEVKGRTLEEIDEMVSPPKCGTFFAALLTSHSLKLVYRRGNSGNINALEELVKTLPRTLCHPRRRKMWRGLKKLCGQIAKQPRKLQLPKLNFFY
jgi:hypothetical protein